MKAIKSTYIPENRPDINDWFKYIANVNSPAINIIRKGGLWYEEGQNNFLKKAKKILQK